VAAIGPETPRACERIRAIRKVLPGSPVVVLAGAIGVDSVVALMRAGVADVIGLPAEPADVVARASLHAAPAAATGDLVGHSPATERLRSELAAVARLRSTILLTGETGVGKGLAARRIHDLSAWRDRPFVHVDCAALASSVIESELFGHERGAYTGAVGARSGRFELAADGTIFLDEIGDLEPGLQAKLLRVLQDRTYERLGGTATRVITARIVAATNRDLLAAVRAGSFRADLYFRLNVFHIHVPALRERSADIPALARAALQRIAERLEVPVPALSDAFYARLGARSWPGNVRELVNALEVTLIRHQGGLLDDLDEFEAFEPLDAPDDEGFETASPYERRRIEDALSACGGNVSRAARRLRLARSTLRYKIARYELAHLIPRD
jgi:DNA-binding NtrC family response regulator